MFPFFEGDLLVGQGEGIGLCTLWTPKDKYKVHLPHVQVIGNLYSRFGIGILIRNVLATPAIQQIVITGTDNPEPRRKQGDALFYGDVEPADLFLEPEQVHEFFARTDRFDARGISVRQPEQMKEFLQFLPPPRFKQLPEPILVPLPEVSHEVYPTSRAGHLFRSNSIREVYPRILREIRTFGEFTAPDSEGHRRQELWQLTVCLSKDCILTQVPHYEDDEIERYGESLWQGDEPEDMTYRYGHTIRYKYGDQVRTAIEAIKKKPETFRTVLTLWEPLRSMLRDDEPCLTTIHPRVRGGLLDMYSYIRTNEMFRGWPKNVAGLRYFQEKFAQALGVEIGELTTTSGSAHLYDLDWPAVDQYLSQAKPPKFRFDPKGDWRFTRSGPDFIAEHYLDGKLLQNFRESSIDRLQKRILPFISDLSHAVYVGREIEKLKVKFKVKLSGLGQVNSF
jgi:thymidylate synthase